MLLAVKEGEEGRQIDSRCSTPDEKLAEVSVPLDFRQLLSQFMVPAPLDSSRAVSGHASPKCQAACQGQGVQEGAQFAVTLSLQRQDSLLLPAVVL